MRFFKYAYLQMPGLYRKVAMRLLGENIYWRDAGQWGIKVKILDGNIVCDDTREVVSHLIPATFSEATFEQWREDNMGYV